MVIHKLFYPDLRPQVSAFDHVSLFAEDPLVVGSSLRNGLPLTLHLFPRSHAD